MSPMHSAQLAADTSADVSAPLQDFIADQCQPTPAFS